jgi:uncharacterized protein (TIGR03435 family)
MPLCRALPLLVAALIVSAAFAQQAPAGGPSAPAKVLTFEVATIKPSARTDGSWRLNPTPDGYTGMGISLLKLVREAYGIYDNKLITGGPVWIDSDKFDLAAKFDAAEIPEWNKLTYRQRADMLQPLLAERFHLRVHMETKDFPVYSLVIARGGPKFQETKPEDVFKSTIGANCFMRGSRNGYVQMQSCMVKDLEGQLRYATGRTVIDRTGLTARYNFELRWAPENTPADSPEAANPSIFTALQEQLGLKLVPGTAPLSVLVIDGAERPAEN